MRRIEYRHCFAVALPRTAAIWVRRSVASTERTRKRSSSDWPRERAHQSLMATRGRLFKNDLRALAAAAQDRPSLEHMLGAVSMPCFIYAGGADKDLTQ